jgi:two-component system, sensor histidine kinase PdtaS
MNKILVVDNNPVMLEFMSEILTQEGYNVKTVDNAVDALVTGRQFKPDLVFVDLIMPYIDGKQLCRLLRRHAEFSDTRIVIISAIAAEEPDFNFREIADAYVAKMPFRIMKPYIIDVIKSLQSNPDAVSTHIIGLDQIYNRDITKELLFSRQHMEVLLSSISDGFFELNTDLQIIYVNNAGSAIFKKDREELLTAYFPTLFSDDIKTQIENFSASLDNQEIDLGIDGAIDLDGRFIRLRFNTVSYGTYRSIIVMIQDVTQQIEAERIIKNDLQKKEGLLKEVHHRVKNNLNIVASLLNLQTTFLSDGVSKKHLTESKNRVESMALMHEQLYHTEDLSGVFLDSYLNDLIAQLINMYNPNATPVRTFIEIPSIHLDLTVAVPLGLIINELISNSLDHGLKNQTDSYISVKFLQEFHTAQLFIHDNGTGLSEGFDPHNNESLGLLLVNNLASQLNGRFDIYNEEDGVTAIVEFKL